MMNKSRYGRYDNNPKWEKSYPLKFVHLIAKQYLCAEIPEPL